MGEIEKFVKNKAFRVHDKITEIIPSVNGMVNEDLLDIHALGSIQRATMSLESFVDISRAYPEEDHTEVTIETDLMVIKAHHYKELIKMIHNLEHSKESLTEALKSLDTFLPNMKDNL